jgi:S-DNA-T family DNA segregation ATPase FtsK/SpoIIIE
VDDPHAEHADDDAVPRVVAPEERTAFALADVFATAESDDFAEDVSGDDDASEAGDDSSVAALLATASPTPSAAPSVAARRRAAPSVSAVAPLAPSAPVPPDATVGDATPAGPPARRSARRGGRKTGAPEAAHAPEPKPTALPVDGARVAPPGEPPPLPSPSAAEPRPADDADREAEEPTTAAAPESLQIVSHDAEIEAARRVAPPLSPELPPPSSAARSVRPDARAERVVEMPGIALLAPASRDGVQFDEAQLRAAADRLIKTLRDYTIDGRVVEIHPGPVVTTYEFVPAAGTKLSKIARLSDDIAMSLEANKVRIVAPIPGKGRVGFEIPNVKRQTVLLRELIETEAFGSLAGALPVAFGKDVVGAPFFADLATMPHLIVAGATGAGKSVGLNVMLTSLLYKRGPEDVRLLMIDPKMVELAVYDGIPHMLLPVVTDMKKASLALRWVVDEMERRYTLFAQTGSRNITSYNERVARALAEGKTMKGLAGSVRTKETGTTMEVPAEGVDAATADEPPRPKRLPYILVVVDEFADLMMVAGKDVESAVARLAQKARAAGIHVILATQRPSVDVITGVIKANFPSRVAFKVSQKVDSRTILDQQGAEHLLGRGDMLILPPGSSDLRRVHCAFVSEDEVQAVADHWRKQGAPTYDEDILRPRDDDDAGGADEPEIRVPMEKYEKAVALVLSSRRCSVSWVQRQLAVGYNVAARMVEKMERDGIVGQPKGPGKDREVLG